MKALITTLLLASTTLVHAEPLSPDDNNRLFSLFGASQDVLARIDGTDADRATLPSEAVIAKDAAACSAAAKDALARKLDPSAPFYFNNQISGQIKTTVITLGDMDEKVCQPVVEKAKGLDDRRAKVAAAAIEAKLGPYKKLGVAGDKLALVDKFWTEVLGPNEANPTPQVVAKSSVLFRLIKDDDYDYTLMRYEFRGNKQIRVTSQSFHHDPPASKYR